MCTELQAWLESWLLMSGADNNSVFVCNALSTLCFQGLHVGDRFTESGNDSATRDCCSILWVANPEETDFFVSMLLKDIRTSRAQAYIE